MKVNANIGWWGSSSSSQHTKIDDLAIMFSHHIFSDANLDIIWNPDFLDSHHCLLSLLQLHCFKHSIEEVDGVLARSQDRQFS